MLLSRNEMIGFAIAIIGVAVMGFLAFHGPFNNVVQTQAKTLAPVHVQILNDAKTIGRYSPAKVTVHVDQAIIFANNSSVNHTVTEANDKFNSGDIGTGGQTWTYIPTKAGTFHYICTYHPFMKGVITVIK